MIGKTGVFSLALVLILTIPLGVAGSTNYTVQIEGDDTSSTGPQTTLCTHSNPELCSEKHFDSGSSVHVGESDNTEDTPWAYYEVILDSSEHCIGDMNVEMRYQVNDVFHREDTFSDHDVFVKLKDFSSGEYHLLDSTVDTRTSNGGGDYEFNGTLDYGQRQAETGNRYYQWGHDTDFVQDSTRNFTHETILGTNHQGDYLRSDGNQHAEIGLYITANPEEDPPNWFHHTRVEVDWIKVNFEDEQIEPENPSEPSFYWQDQSMWSSPDQPAGPTYNGWYNSLSSPLMVSFGIGGKDACSFDSLEYLWRSDTASPPTDSTSGTVILPENTHNRNFSDINTPSNSGSYKFYWRAVDTVGNKAIWQSSETINFDYNNPQIHEIIADQTWYNEENLPTLVWDPASDSYSGVSDYQIIQFGVGTMGEVMHEEGRGEYSFEVESSTLTTGSNQFLISARDNTQPRNTNSQVVDIKYDNMSPIVNYPFLDGEKYTTNNPEISWSSPLAYDGQMGSGLSRCIIEIDGLQILEINKDECSSTNGNIILPAIEDGTYQFVIIACDVANNCNEDNNPRSFVINTGFEIERNLIFAMFITISVIFTILAAVLYYKDEIWNGL